MSAAGVFPAIPGIDLAEDQKDEMFSICLTLAILGVLFVGLRCFARWQQSKQVPLALDDYLIIPALLCALGTTACALEASKYGGGRHLATLTLDDFINVFKVTYAYTFLWVWALTFTKLSILAFYKRVFGPSIPLYICAGLAVCYFVSVTIAWGLVCRPISFFWIEYIAPESPGYCFNVQKFDLGNAIANLIIDFAVLLVPLPTIAKLQMPLRQKIGVAGVLLLGSFVTVASIIRLTKVSVMNSNQSDVTWYMGAVLVWSCIEPFVGIFCACLPTYPPLIRLIFRKFSSTISSTLKASKSGLSYGNNSRGGTNTFHEEDNKFGGRHRVRRLGSDDELGLTNNIVGGGPMSPGMDVAREWGKVDEEMGYPMNAITVKKEVDRTSIAESDEGAPKRASRAY